MGVLIKYHAGQCRVLRGRVLESDIPTPAVLGTNPSPPAFWGVSPLAPFWANALRLSPPPFGPLVPPITECTVKGASRVLQVVPRRQTTSFGGHPPARKCLEPPLQQHKSIRHVETNQPPIVHGATTLHYSYLGRALVRGAPKEAKMQSCALTNEPE